MASDGWFEFRRGSDPRSDDDMRVGAERRQNVELRTGLSVLLAGCPDCGRIAPSPADMHSEGWLIVADDTGVRLIACPEHRARFEGRGVFSA